MLKGPRLWFIRLQFGFFRDAGGTYKVILSGPFQLSLVCGVSPTFRFGTVPKPVPARLKRMLKRLQDSSMNKCSSNRSWRSVRILPGLFSRMHYKGWTDGVQDVEMYPDHACRMLLLAPPSYVQLPASWVQVLFLCAGAWR